MSGDGRGVIDVVVGYPNASAYTVVDKFLRAQPQYRVRLVDWELHSVDGLIAKCQHHQPLVILIDSTLPGFDPQTLARIAEVCAGYVVVSAPAERADQYYRIGARVVVDPPVPAAVGALVTRLQQVGLAALAERHNAHSAKVPHATGPLGASSEPLRAGAPYAELPNAATRSEGIFVVWGVQDGLGRRTVAVNLAASLAFHGGKRVALLDLRRPYSAMRAHFAINPALYARSLYSLVKETQLSSTGRLQFDSERIKHNLIPIKNHQSPDAFKLHLLLGPQGEQQAYDEVFDQYEGIVPQLLHEFHRRYEYVIVDIGSDVLTDPLSFGALHMADRLLVVTNLHQPFIDLLQQRLPTIMGVAKLEERNIDLIINRELPQSPVKADQVHKQLKIPPMAILPEAQVELETAIRQGEPLILSGEDDSNYVFRFKLLVNRYAEVYADPGNSPGRRLRGLFRR